MPCQRDPFGPIPVEDLAAHLDTLERDVVWLRGTVEWLCIEAIDRFDDDAYWEGWKNAKAKLEQAIQKRDEARARLEEAKRDSAPG